MPPQGGQMRAGADPGSAPDSVRHGPIPSQADLRDGQRHMAPDILAFAPARPASGSQRAAGCPVAGQTGPRADGRAPPVLPGPGDGRVPIPGSVGDDVAAPPGGATPAAPAAPGPRSGSEGRAAAPLGRVPAIPGGSAAVGAPQPAETPGPVAQGDPALQTAPTAPPGAGLKAADRGARSGAGPTPPAGARPMAGLPADPDAGAADRAIPAPPFDKGLGAAPPLPGALLADAPPPQTAPQSGPLRGADPGLALARQTAEAIVQGSASGQIELALDPVELGRVRLWLTPVDQGMTVLLTAERPETLDLMRRHADLLSGALRDLGYANVSLGFAGDGPGGGGARTGPGAPSAPASGPETSGAAPPGSTARPGPVAGRIDLRF